MSITYPTGIFTEDGWTRIHKGHGLDREVLLGDLVYCDGEQPIGYEFATSEEWFIYRPRIKHCDEFGCDSDGVEFHAHWSPVRPGNPEAAYTLTGWKRVTR